MHTPHARRFEYDFDKSTPRTVDSMLAQLPERQRRMLAERGANLLALPVTAVRDKAAKA